MGSTGVLRRSVRSVRGLRSKPWRRRIAEARRRGRFTAQDRYNAARWNLCAVGESLHYPHTEEAALHKPLADFKIVPPVVSHQENAAIQFVCAVEADDFDAAGVILTRIMAEAARLAPSKRRASAIGSGGAVPSRRQRP